MSVTFFTTLANLLPERIGSRLRTSSMAQRVGNNAVWLGLDKVYGTTVAFVVSVFVARYLGRSDFGLFSYTLAFVTIFRIVADLGLEEVLVRELVRHPDLRNEILGTACILRLCSGVLVMGIIAVAVRIVCPHEPFTRLLVIITSLLYIPQAGMLVQRWNGAQLQAKYNVLASNGALTLVSAARLLMIWLHAGLVWFVWTNVALIGFNAAFLILLFLHSGESVAAWRFRGRQAWRLLSAAWLQIPSGLASAIQNQIGTLIIGTMLGDAVLGPYAVAYRFYALLLLVPDIVCQSLAPMLTQVHGVGEQLFRRRLEQSYRLMLGLYVLTLIPTAFLGFWGIRAMYGPQFAEGGRLVMYMAAPLLLIYLNQLRLWYIIIENLLAYATGVSIIQAVVAIAANWLLVRKFGPAGAILATTLAGLSVFAADAFFRPARRNLVAIGRAVLPR